jgi:hypothetical protein
MTVTRTQWSHPASYAEAKARLIGRQRYNRERRRFAGLRRDEEVWPLLLRFGMFEWGTVTKIAQELGISKATASRDRAAILRVMLGL